MKIEAYNKRCRYEWTTCFLLWWETQAIELKIFIISKGRCFVKVRLVLYYCHFSNKRVIWVRIFGVVMYALTAAEIREWMVIFSTIRYALLCSLSFVKVGWSWVRIQICPKYEPWFVGTMHILMGLSIAVKVYDLVFFHVTLSYQNWNSVPNGIKPNKFTHSLIQRSANV